MNRPQAGLALAALAILATFAGVSSTSRTPAPLDAGAAPEAFSAGRALEHLRVIAAEPRPGGSEAHAKARRYIVETVASLGLEARVQETVVAHRDPVGIVLASDIANLLVRLPGSGGSGAVLFLCHYDTVPNSPGAGDDGAAVAAFLETLRALQQGPPRANDLIFLFADAEESGLLGARAFVDQHPWAQEIGLVVNFEARGSAGPALMFETSRGNAPLIRALRRGAPDPFAASYSYEIYKVLPNDTDFTVFRQAGLPGLNFAFIHGPTAYHTAADRVQRLEPGSLQHQGETLLGLARHLGAIDLDSPMRGGESTYFRLPGSLFVSYPALLEPIFAVLGLLLAIYLLFRASGRGRVRPAPIMGSVFFHLSCLFLFGVLGFVAFQAATYGSPPMGPLGPYSFAIWGGGSSTAWQLGAVALAMAALALWTYRLGRKILTAEHLFAGALVLWALLALALALAAPGASFLFTLPLLAVCAPAYLWLLRPPQETEQAAATVGGALLGALAAALLVVAALWVPALALAAVALTSPGAILIAVAIWLLLGGLLGLLPEVLGRSRGGMLLAWGLALAALGLSLAVRSASRHGPENPRPDTMIYAYNATTDVASWFSLDRRPDAWTRQFLGEEPERMPLLAYIGFPRPALRAQAPKLSLPGASVEILGKEPAAGGGELLRLRFAWPYAVDRARLFLASNSEIRALHFGDERLESKGSIGPSNLPYKVFLIYQALAEESFEVGVEMGGPDPLEIEAAAQTYGLPQMVFFPWDPRPPELMPHLGWETDSTFLRNALRVDQAETPPEPRGAEEADEEAAGT